MDTKQMKQEEFLQILMHAYRTGEQRNVSTKEMVEEIILQMKKVYAS
ncbi:MULTISPECIES: hypothetical protein [Bacillaceae]|uniref:Uncharacterized protein n=2 Tax=Metabacillus TaxID=2675233 RepID=A0ABS5LJ70_9BACI|nr:MULTISPECIES: hypothetical protein [Bacillaceae]MBS2970801.1 hypothetical protein [Metabacillus flavus]